MIPEKYRKQPPVQVNYSFEDLLANVGYVELVCVFDEADEYSFQRLPLDSTTKRKNYGDIGVGLQGEVNIDYTFLTSQLVKGNAFLSITLFAQALSTQTTTCYLKIRVLHVSGVTETLIGTQQTTDTLTQTDDAATLYHRTTLKFALDKQFTKGEILRVEIETWSDHATNTNKGFYVDGGNKAWGQTEDSVAIGSNIILEVPFDLGGVL